MQTSCYTGYKDKSVLAQIPTGLLSEQSLLVALLVAAIPAVWKVHRNEVDRYTTAVEATVEQRVLVERALTQIQYREFERDQAKHEVEKCERELERKRDFHGTD